MAQNKNQHYVPKFYFRLFSQNGKTICLFNIPKELFIESASIAGQCSKNYFYNKNIEVEKAFAQLEGLIRTKLNLILENKRLDCLSKEEIEHLKAHILFQYGRTKFARDRENELANYLFDLLKPKMYSDAKEKGKDILWESIENAKIILNSSHALLISMMSGILLNDLNIALLENESKIDFIFSDNPVVFFNSFFNETRPQGTIGIASTGLQIFYPINSKYMLFLYDPDYYAVSSCKIRISKNKDIQRLNGLQILNCDENIYFQNFNMKEKISERYNQIKSKKPNKKNEYEIMGSRIAEDGTYRELLRTSAPKIRYNLHKLSFFQHKATDKPFGVRNPLLVSLNNKIIDAVLDGKIRSMSDLELFLKDNWKLTQVP